jgi:hypothetical protein
MQPKIIVIYSYYQKNDEYVKNLEFFINNGIYNDIDYIFCINGKECSIDLPSGPNIKILKRDNIDYDFGAYSDALKTININLYDYIFFINTSVRGPFIPQQERLKMAWTEPFLKLFINDVKLVGTSINIFSPNHIDSNVQVLIDKGYELPLSHIQSQMFVLNKESLNFLNSKGFFNQSNETDFNRFIMLREVLMSQLILKNGWNINCILSKYKDLDYRTLKTNINTTSVDGDPYYPGAYFGESIEPYDVIFIKTNRNVSPQKIIELTDKYYISNIHTLSTTTIIEPFANANGNDNCNCKIKFIINLIPTLFILALLIYFIYNYYYKQSLPKILLKNKLKTTLRR